MNIGIYIGQQLESYGGGYTFVREIVKALIKHKTHNKFIFIYEGKKPSFLENCTSEEIISTTKRKNFFSKKKITSSNVDSIFKNNKIDLLYCASPTVCYTSIPYIATVWDLGHRRMPWFPEMSIKNWTFEQRENLYSTILPKASYIITGNNVSKNDIKNFYCFDEERIITIPMVAPNDLENIEACNTILEKYKLEKNKFIFYPAQFWSHKNHIRILMAMKTLKKQGFKAVFTGADFGNMEYIKSKVKEYNLENDVLFLGFITRNEIKALYENAYALVYASMLGPDNIPPLEAMILNCPVICAEYFGAKEQLKDCVLYFDPINENEIIQNIELLKNEQVKTNLIKKGSELASNCSIENYIIKLSEVFDKFEKYKICWGEN